MWDTYPTLAERRQSGEPAPLPSREERRRVSSPRVVLPGTLAAGWLTFQSGIDRKRLSPIPNGWEYGTEEQLRGWMDAATPIGPARRLIE